MVVFRWRKKVRKVRKRKRERAGLRGRMVGFSVRGVMSVHVCIGIHKGMNSV